MLAVFGAGALAGLVLFSVQHFTLIPLIQAAETYEAAHSDVSHENKGWQPAEGWERTSFTALTTVLTGIGFAAMLFGVMAVSQETINTRHGAAWGLAAFACFSLAPALGLPPQPPGVAVADLQQRQIWWASTVIATAIGLWFLSRQRPRVRVPSSPPFIPNELFRFRLNHRGPKRARFRALFCVPFGPFFLDAKSPCSVNR